MDPKMLPNIEFGVAFTTIPLVTCLESQRQKLGCNRRDETSDPLVALDLISAVSRGRILHGT